MYGKSPDRCDRFINYVGEGFLLGGVLGSACHFVGGLRRSPRGGRLAGGARAASAGAPRVACLMGAYSAVFSSVEIALSAARGREDPWNSVAGATVAMGLLNVRRGAPAASGIALAGAAFAVVCYVGVTWAVSERHSRIISHREALEYLYLPRPDPRSWMAARGFSAGGSESTSENKKGSSSAGGKQEVSAG